MGLGNLAQKIRRLLGGQAPLDETFFSALEELLIEGDLSLSTAESFCTQLRNAARTRSVHTEDALRTLFAEIMESCVRVTHLAPNPNQCSLYLLLGVNGSGKTTSAAKLAAYYQTQKVHPILFAAADTFRAAAAEQLAHHGAQLGVRVIAHPGGKDPAAVVFDAGEALRAQKRGLLLVDTAGRLHNKTHLIAELQKIDRIAQTKVSADAYRKILVLDATTGQNAFRQAQTFHEAIGVDALLLAKCDTRARGGAVFSIMQELGIPLAFLGWGESYTDLVEANAREFVSSFLHGER